jgi:hypothetical protein
LKEFARQLRALLEKVEPLLMQMPGDDPSVKPAADEWSKKEILGHLIDSAANNHQRFVRAAYGAATQFPPYEQETWVRIQQYNQRPWKSLIALWSAYNRHLIHVIESLPEDARSAACNIGKDQPAALDFVVKDYHSHLLLHLKDILDEAV